MLKAEPMAMQVPELVLEVWRILAESAVFILVGFVIAAMLHVALSRGAAARHLSDLGTRSVFLAALVGLPLPLCSCSVLPAAITLRRKGASKGATLSFLVSTPETGVTSILLTYALLGPLMAVVRPVAALVSAMAAGLADNLIEKRWPSSNLTPDSGGECASADHTHPRPGDEPAPGTGGGFRDGLRFAFVDLFDDIVGWLLIGIVVAAVLNVLVPPPVLQTVFGGPFQSMLVMLVIGIPLYVCAEASTPIAAAFIAAGISPGAALVFLLVGPATNIGSVGVLVRQLGRRTVGVYLAAISVVALLMGWALNWLLAGRGIDLTARAMSEPFIPAWLKTGGAVAFLMLAVVSMERLRPIGKALSWLDARLPVPITRRTAGVTVGLLAVAAYVVSGLFIIQPGERGYVRRLGRVVRRDLPPGLYFAAPRPFGRVDRIRPEEVRRLALGYVPASDRPSPALLPGPAETADNPAESWMLLGDENVVNVKSAVHYAAAPGRGYDLLYGIADTELLVRSATLAALRRYLSTQAVDTVLTTDRPRAEDEIARLIQHRLDAAGAGIVCRSFAFLDLHAPESVHPAFRDVASAMEDKATRINQARTIAAQVLPLVRGQGAELLAQADSYRTRVVHEAAGRAERFVRRQTEFAAAPQITRQRIYFETIDAVLPRLRKYIKPPPAAGGELEIWFTRRADNPVPIPLPGDQDRSPQPAR